MVFRFWRRKVNTRTGAWVPEAEIGVHWDDPQLEISWPLPPTELSDRDRCLPLLSDIISIL